MFEMRQFWHRNKAQKPPVTSASGEPSQAVAQ
jgi:hypothetical protein